MGATTRGHGGFRSHTSLCIFPGCLCGACRGTGVKVCVLFFWRQEYMQTALSVRMLDGFGQWMTGPPGQASCSLAYAGLDALDEVRGVLMMRHACPLSILGLCHFVT
jgi:hypothetical protein